MQQENQNPPYAESCYNCGIKNPETTHIMWCREVNKPKPKYHSKQQSQLKEQKSQKQEASVPLQRVQCQNCNIPTFTSFHAFKAQNIQDFWQNGQTIELQGPIIIPFKEVPQQPPQLLPQPPCQYMPKPQFLSRSIPHVPPFPERHLNEPPQLQVYQPQQQGGRNSHQRAANQSLQQKPQRRFQERTQFKFGVESLIREQNRLGVNDMTPEQLYEFFTEKDAKVKQGYDEKVIRNLRGSILKQDSQEICQVCQEMQLQSEKVFELTSCGHSFHFDCFCQWLTYSKACPICKKQVIL